MQFLSAIAIIVLLFVAYNYMNQAHEDENSRDPVSGKRENATNGEPKEPGPDNPGPAGRGKVLNFMEYKRRKSGPE